MECAPAALDTNVSPRRVRKPVGEGPGHALRSNLGVDAAGALTVVTHEEIHRLKDQIAALKLAMANAAFANENRQMPMFESRGLRLSPGRTRDDALSPVRSGDMGQAVEAPELRSDGFKWATNADSKQERRSTQRSSSRDHAMRLDDLRGSGVSNLIRGGSEHASESKSPMRRPPEGPFRPPRPQTPRRDDAAGKPSGQRSDAVLMCSSWQSPW